MKKIRVREHWEEVIIRFTDVEVVDEDDNIIESHNVYKEDIETIDSGDNKILTEEEAIGTCSSQSKLYGKIMEVEISLQNEFKFEQDCICWFHQNHPGLNQSSIEFFHKRKNIKVIELEKGFELLVWKSVYIDNGDTIYYCKIVSDNPNDFIDPELLKKGKKFKVLM